MVGLLIKCNLSDSYYLLAERVLRERDARLLSLFERFRAYLANMPDRERARLRRIGLQEDAQLDCLHPPTVQRIEAVEAYPAAAPTLTLDSIDHGNILVELRGFEPVLHELAWLRYTHAVLPE